LAVLVRLDRAFYERHSTIVAAELIGKILTVGECSGRIIEVEAYAGADDAASHAFRGRTARNAVMFGPGGYLYVYFTYGMHHCANVVTGASGDAQAVLLRALQPLTGIDLMVERRRRRGDVADGPGKLCQAMGLDRSHDGSSLLSGPFGIYDDGWTAPSPLLVSPRVGITKAVDRPWRWRVA
jgi:DNA-3-methyladenine glycosylase